MATLIHNYDWLYTPVGRLKDCPQALRINVDTAWATLFPSILIWGLDLTVCAYNSVYRPLFGNRPEALGRPFRKSK
jgi:hypothetical protein